jgi:hypothetical protein
MMGKRAWALHLAYFHAELGQTTLMVGRHFNVWVVGRKA